MKRLSSGFSGGSTRKIAGVDKEVESRLGKIKRMDVFTDDFNPPGTSEKFPGADFTKRDAPYEQPHDDLVPENQNRVKVTNEMAASGNAKDQEALDYLDEIQGKIEAPIKNPYDQFPGDLNFAESGASEVAKFDVHQTDPARLASTPKDFDKRVEARMKRLVNGEIKSDNADLNDQRRFTINKV